MRHLFHTRAEVLRLSQEFHDGAPTMSWDKVSTIVDPLLGEPGELMCRLDLNFVRPGKDQPMPVVAGRAPDRVGLMFFDATAEVLAGDRIRAISGPIAGTFEIRAAPDPAAGFSQAHHHEVQVIEVTRSLTNLLDPPSLGALS